MDDLANILKPVKLQGLEASLDSDMHVAALRHFEFDNAFADAVLSTLGAPLPREGRVELTAHRKQVLAWRRPSEALLLSKDREPLRRLRAATAALDDGCIVDLTGGASVIRLVGTTRTILLSHLCGPDAVPIEGESRTGRWADLRVTAIGFAAGETWLVVERAYLPHLMDWIRVSASDFS
jgi:hypothetical protein